MVGRMDAVTVGGEAAIERESLFAAGDSVKRARGEDGAEQLGDNVGRQFAGREALCDDQADRDGGVEMAAGDVADGECHGKHGEAEGECDPGESDAEPRVRGREDSCAAASKDQPESSEQFCDHAFVQRHGRTCLSRF